MKGVQYEKPHTVKVVNKALRPLKENEVLVKVSSCGICGTDVHIVEGTSRSTPPVILGHEYGGVVEDIGISVRDISVGQAVAVDPNISCGVCFYCRRGLVHLCANLRALGVDLDGGMAEYSIVPRPQLHAVTTELAPETIAFIEPVSCAVHGIDRANIQAGDTVVIVGGGTIGLIMLQLAKTAGAARTVLIEPLASKRQIARQLGADIVLEPGETGVRNAISKLASDGADVVIECAGKVEAVEQAVTLARRGGTVVLFGVCPIGTKATFIPHEIYFRELTIVGSYVSPYTFSRAIELLQTGGVRVNAFHVDKFPLDGFLEALQFQREGRTTKSLILPTL